MYNSASIIIFAKYEHDFINQWVEYHVKIGFSHFYILIDNILEKQPEYIINDNISKYVTLINMDENDVIKYFGNTISNVLNPHMHISFITHQLINHKIINANLIKEDWVTAIGIDQFIYLNGITIQEYLLNLDEKCTQIIFPWSYCCHNINDSNYDYFLKNINLYKCDYAKSRGHSNGMIKTKNMLAIDTTSHGFTSKSHTQYVHVIDEYYHMGSRLDIMYIFKIVNEKLINMSFNDLKISSFHIVLRNINEYFIKGFFYWKRDKNNNKIDNAFYYLSKDIKEKNINNYKHYGDYIRAGVNIFIKTPILLPKENINLKIPDLENKNLDNTYYDIIMNKLNKYDITKEEFMDWKQ